MNPTSLLIHASEVAACVGRHAYQRRSDMLMTVLKRLDHAAHAAHVGRTGMLTRAEEVSRAVDKARVSQAPGMDTVRTAIASAERVGVSAAPGAAPVELHRALDDAAPAVESIADDVLTSEDKALLLEHCRSVAYTGYGTNQEASIAAEQVLEARLGGRVEKDDRYRKRQVLEVDGVRVSVGGRVDGIVTDASGGKTLVEIKSRVRRLFRRVVEYERVQVLTYLYVWAGKVASSAKLVERYGSDVLVHDVESDESYWGLITGELGAFVREVLEMRTSALSALDGGEGDAGDE